MEAHIAWRVTVDMFDDGGIILASFFVLTMVNHSGILKTS